LQCNSVKSPTFRQTDNNYNTYIKEKRGNSQYLDGSPYRHKKHAIWDSYVGESVGYYVLGFYVYGFVHRSSILIIVQRDATQSSLFIILQVQSTCFGCQTNPSSGVHKSVTTAPGTGHIFVQYFLGVKAAGAYG